MLSPTAKVVSSEDEGVEAEGPGSNADLGGDGLSGGRNEGAGCKCGGGNGGDKGGNDGGSNMKLGGSAACGMVLLEFRAACGAAPDRPITLMLGVIFWIVM